MMVWSAGLGYIKYQMGYTSIPGDGTIPTPFSLWPAKYQSVTPTLYYFLVGSFAMLLSIHIEETCFWIHLSASIRGNTTRTWLSSIWFKCWVLGTCLGIGSLLGAVIPVQNNVQQMETNALLVGTLYSTVFTVTSLYVVIRFPALFETVRLQGGSQIVIARLRYQRRLTGYRMVSRVVFVVPFLTISIDGLTPHHDVGHNQFWTDLFIIVGLIGLFASTIISVFMFFPPSSPAPTVTLPPLLRISKPLPSLMSPQPMLSPTKFPSLMPAELGLSTEVEQIKSYRSIVAPFATPPVSPTVPVSPVRPKTTSGSTTRTAHSAGKSDGHDDGLIVGDGGFSLGTQDGTGITGSMRTHTNASAYAWSLLAEHLRLPENAMGMMVKATENDQRGWQAARREAEHMLLPQNLRSESSHLTPFPPRTARRSGDITSRLTSSPSQFRSLAPPPRSPPKRVFGVTYPPESDEAPLTIVLGRGSTV
ncbi:hypothetical protein JCM24511_08224 [Saitozyma sp. JCM 24511]|nr:hypothetical protein JCM24511_08224 [Saitozyma sp. JCM 24511]